MEGGCRRQEYTWQWEDGEGKLRKCSVRLGWAFNVELAPPAWNTRTWSPSALGVLKGFMSRDGDGMFQEEVEANQACVGG